MAKVKGETRNSSTSSGQIPSTVRHPLRKAQSYSSPKAQLGVAILEKLTSLEELLKKWESMLAAKDDRPLTFKEACSYLGYAPSYLYKLTYKNVIPHYKPTGKMIFFSKNEVDQWIYKSSVERRVMSDDASTSLGMTKDDGSAQFTTKDPNQMEIFNKPKDQDEEALGNSKKAIEAEVVIEFQLKSRRKTLRQAQGDKE